MTFRRQKQYLPSNTDMFVVVIKATGRSVDFASFKNLGFCMHSEADTLRERSVGGNRSIQLKPMEQIVLSRSRSVVILKFVWETLLNLANSVVFCVSSIRGRGSAQQLATPFQSIVSNKPPRILKSHSDANRMPGPAKERRSAPFRWRAGHAQV